MCRSVISTSLSMPTRFTSAATWLRPRRQDRNCVHLDEISGIGEARDLQQRRGRQCAFVAQKGSAHLAVGVGVLLNIGEVSCEPYNVIHRAADRSERRLDVRKRLHGLVAKSLRGLSAGIDSGLAGDKDETMRTVDLDELTVSRRLRQPGRIGMSDIRPRLRLS